MILCGSPHSLHLRLYFQTYFIKYVLKNGKVFTAPEYDVIFEKSWILSNIFNSIDF